MLTQYKNLNQILNASASLSGDRFDSTDHNLVDNAASLTPVYNITNYQTELHIYSNQTWLSGNHGVIINETQPVVNIPNQTAPLQLGYTPLNIDLYKEFSNLNITSGNFRIVVNFFKNLIGSYSEQFLFVDEISPDRTELKLRITDPSNTFIKYQVTDFISKVHQNPSVTLTPTYVSHQVTSQNHKTYILNFSRNKTLKFINSVVIDGEFLFVKLQDPAPEFVESKLKCWVVEELKYPYIDKVSLKEIVPPIEFNRLSNPNWDATAAFNISSETGLKNWNDLLGSSIQTSQQIIDSYFSGSLSGIKLNIDYSDFNNFIFYSSATERLNNFKYKLELLEYYTNQINILNTISGSTSTTTATDYNTTKNALIGGFDEFEKFLYYQSSSVLYSQYVPHESPTVAAVTGSYIKPAPKTNATYPYSLYPVTSSQFTTWYNNLITSASLYDSLNLNKLTNNIPLSMQTNESNIDLITFVDMLGHHYDILYTYIKHMSTTSKREENPKLGMPNELLYSVAKQFGWNLQDGSQYQELWEYTLGTNSAGIPLTGSNSVGDPSVPGREMTRTVWRRIVNNLPLLLKSKGTKRSVQALLSCYGIPQSMISINEYGGPRIDQIPIYERLNFDYALDLINNATGTVNINYTAPVNSVELRFRTDDVITYPTLPTTMNLITVSGSQVNVILNYTRGTLGTVTIYDHNLNTATSNEIELFDGNWLSMLVKKNGTNLDLHVNKSKYGKIIAAVSASITGSIPSTGSITLGGTAVGASRLRGQLQELRMWSSSLDIDAFNNHVKAPAAYDGNFDSYDELIFRLPLTQKIDHSLTGSLIGVQPAQSSISASFSSWVSNTPYDSIEEIYYYDSVSAGLNTYDDNKVRLEANNLVGTLDVKTRAERSQYDTAPLDSNKLGVYFSPETMIDEDIIAQFGYIDLDDYIGDTSQTAEKSYPDLINFSQRYWKKYETKNDINAYIKIFTLYDMSFFNQLEQLLPTRADKITGLLIQPTLLERSKDTIMPKISHLNETYDSVIDAQLNTINSEYVTYDSQLSGMYIDLSNSYVAGNFVGSTDLVPNQYVGSTSIIGIGGTGTTGTTTGGTTGGGTTGGTGNGVNIGGGNNFNIGTINITSSTFNDDYRSYTRFISGGAWYRTYQRSQFAGYRPRGVWNHEYGGSRMTSPAINVPSADTVDGKPVVEIINSDPNQLIYRGGILNRGAFRTFGGSYTARPPQNPTGYNSNLYE